MRTKLKLAVRSTLVAALVAGSLAARPLASAGQDSTAGGCTATDHELIEQLMRTESVFSNGTPGSAAQFRARESAYELWEKLFPTR